MNDHQKKEKIKYLLLIHVALLTHEKNQKKLEKEKITMTFLLGLSYIEYLSR